MSVPGWCIGNPVRESSTIVSSAALILLDIKIKIK
jgi:hypothetical protein